MKKVPKTRVRAEIREIEQRSPNHSPFAIYVDSSYHCAADSREHAIRLLAERFPNASMVWV